MYTMNGIVLNLVRTFDYKPDVEFPNYLVEKGTKCFELQSEDGRYTVVGDKSFVEQLRSSEAA